MGIDRLEVKGGVLRLTSSSDDPALRSPSLRVRASRFTRVVVEMRADEPGSAQLFFTTAAQPQVSESASAHVAIAAHGEFRPYAFEVGHNALWGGCVKSMRLDPTNKAGVTVEIRAIRLQ